MNKNSNKSIKKLLLHILTIWIKHYFVSYCPSQTQLLLQTVTVISNFSTICNANFLYLIYFLKKKKNSHPSSRAINATCKTYSTSDNETPPISRVLIGRHLIFADWRHHRAVTRLENVRRSNIWRGKKLGFQLSHNHPQE